jgi:hypothetical protein
VKRRALWEIVSELVESVRPLGEEASLVRVTQLDVTLPVELAFVVRDGEPVILGDAPRWRWRSAFDATPSRMRLTLGALDPTDGVVR